MNKFFLDRIKRLGFNDSVSEILYFRELPNSLIRLIMSLDKQDFINYISFVVRLKRNLLLIGNEEKLIRITNMIILNMKSYSTRTLMDLISNTNILEHKQLFDFSALLLQLTNEYKINAIYEVIFNIKNLNKVSIIKLIQMVKRVKNNFQLKELVKLLLRSDIRKHKYFINFTEMILKNPDNINYLYINKCLNCDELLNHKDVLTLLYKYLMTAKTNEEVNLIYTIITNEAMLKSSYLYKLLDTLKDNYSKNYLSSIKEIVLLKDKINDYSFDLILTNLFKTKNDLQKTAILLVLKYDNLLSDSIQLSYVLNKCLNINYRFQLDSLEIILEIILKQDSFDFYQENIMLMIETIIANGNQGNNKIKDYQALALVKSFDYLINSKDIYNLIQYIKNLDEVICYYVPIVLSINGIQELKEFYQILDEICKTKTENKIKAIIYLLKKEDIIKANNCLKLIYLINQMDDYFVSNFIKVVYSLSNLQDKNLMKILEVFALETDFDRHDALVIIISNYELLGSQKTLNYVNSIKDKEKKGCKEVLKKMKEELTDLVDNDTKMNNNTKKYRITK